MVQKKYRLNTGVEIPAIGFGTFGLENNKKAPKIVASALECGYRLIDTASIYQTEEAVGKAIEKSGIAREDIFVCSKLWTEDQGYKKVYYAFERTLDKLKVDYLDAYLIHWPIPENHEDDYKELNYESWCAMEELYSAGRIRAIGVSNFLKHHLRPLEERAKIKPMINQIEVNTRFQQKGLVKYCQDHSILVQAWAPLIHGEVNQVRLLNYLAERYQKTPSQIAIRWCLQRKCLPIAKTSSVVRMCENMDVYDFEIPDEDMSIIADLDIPAGHSKFEQYDLQQKY